MPWRLEESGCFADDQRLVCVVRILREAEGVCFSTMKSLLGFLSSSKARQGWSLVAKLALQPKSSSGLGGEANEVERIDQALSALNAKKIATDAEDVQSIHRQLGGIGYDHQRDRRWSRVGL